MLVFSLLLTLLIIATITDFREQKIYNWTTYPGIILGLLVSGVITWSGRDAISGTDWDRNYLGGVTFAESVTGALVCGFLMLVCFVFFPGGVGGGDVKLMAMIGAFLGVYQGLEALLWTFVLGGCLALCILVWRHGAVGLIRDIWRACGRLLLRSPALSAKDDVLKTQLFLSPSALLAVLIVCLPSLIR